MTTQETLKLIETWITLIRRFKNDRRNENRKKSS